MSTISYLTAQKKRAKDYLDYILDLSPTTTSRLDRILMNKETGFVGMSTNNSDYEESNYLINSYHSSSIPFTKEEKARFLFSMLHRFNLKAYKLNNDWEHA